MTDGHASPVRIGSRPLRRVALTHGQSQIWTSQRLHPHVPLANMAYRFRIGGPVDADRMVRAVDTVVRAADVLRMAIDDDGSFTARIVDAPPTTTEVVNVPAPDVDDWIAARISAPVDATVCTYDSVLLRHADDDWTWWLDLHHVATDAASSALVFRATALAYENDDGAVDHLGTVIDGRYFDTVASRPDSVRTTDDATRQPPLTPYGLRGPRTTTTVRMPVEPTIGLDDAVRNTYRSLSRDLSLLTLSAMTMALAVRRLDGRRTIVMGVPIHHRSSSAARRLVGPLMELHPLVVSVDDAETNRAMFARVQRSIMDLLRSAAPGASPDGGFEIVLNVFSADYGDFAGYPTTVEWVRAGHVDPAHSVRSQLSDHGGSVTWDLDVNTELSADDSWRRLPQHVGTVAAHLVDRPDARCGDVSLAGPAELADLRLLDAAAPIEFDDAPLDEPIHEQVRRHLATPPNRVVAEEDGVTIDAATFDRRADAVARYLVGAGVDRGDTVGLRMRRSIDVLIAIHGVLRAGGAFVMLDPNDPPARHGLIAADADFCLTLDSLPVAADRQADQQLPQVGLDDVAYILYTSGSTGAPKGVPISHRGLAAYMRFAADAYVDHDEPVVALHSALVFDLTITSLFLSFLTGGTAIVYPDEPVIALGRIARDDRITILKATPSQLDLFTRIADADRPRPLRSVIVGGEAFRRPVAERLRAACVAGVRIYNEYGPTEAVVGCMIHEYDPTVDTGTDVPIGRAAPGCEIRILDDLGQRSPIGAWGELYVRRDGMATGYLNLPELSAERFVDLDGDGRRWYRTGDRTRVERPGVATYGGRMDDQLKVNGIRLEPSEVEAALVSHPDVDTALVRVWSPADRSAGDVFRCVRCGLGADVPGTTFSVDGVCNTCHAYDAIEPQARAWFRTEADLDRRLADVRSGHDGEIDCLHLLSGGKDSTYALYQLVERGWRVHALTLDNGFISDGAKDNIRRSVADLGITHEFATTGVMNEIFRDSLDRYSNVCQGCYKTIYTIAVARARELGIPVVVTGLSRGQFFETRLIPHQFEHGRFDPDAIDRTVLEARRSYHATPDAVTELLPEQVVFDDPDIFERVEFVDFYRYVDVELAEVYEFLERRAPWVRPADTGRSTNCLINVAGIQVHRREQGFHNYAEPYSWDVRLGHKTRTEALTELDDDADDAEVARMLGQVGYQPKSNEVLTAWYQARTGTEPNPDDLRAHLRSLLPEHAVPSAFVRLDEMPMTSGAKVDVAALPAPTRIHRRGDLRVEPTTVIEQRLCEIWAEVLGLESVGVSDDFFDLGGASLAALEVVAAIDDQLGTDLHDAAVFRHRTIRELAAVVAAASLSTGDDPIPSLPNSPLSPGEEAMLFDHRSDPAATRYNVTRLYTITGDVELDRLEVAIRDVAMHHGPLHTSYAPDRHRLSRARAVGFQVVPITREDEFARFADLQRTVPFDLDDGPLVRVHAAATGAERVSLLIGLHHISIDAGTFDEFWDQIARRYAGAELPPLANTYAEHGAWQRSATSTESAAYWAARSARRRPIASVTLAAPRPAVADGYLSRVVDLRPDELGTAGGTPFAAAMAATAATLSLFTADRTVGFGITASSKDHPATAPLVGYYLNTLPVECEVERRDTFASLVRSAGTIVTESLPHRTYPFADIVRDARAAGHETPTVSVMLAFEALARPELGSATVQQRILASGTAVADISLIVQQRVDGVEVGVEYRGSVVDGTDAGRILDVFASLLVGGVRDPSATVADLVEAHLADDLLGDEPVGDEPVGDELVIHRILARAVSTPTAFAVECNGTVLTYAELVTRARGAAARLIAKGPVRLVGVAVDRSVDVVVGLIAAQLAGAAYVPLDPTVGGERLRHIVEHAGLDRLLIRGGPTFGLPAELVIDLGSAAIAGGDGDGIELPVISPDDPAYVMFTSGTTGRPRGVEVSHANLAASTAARTQWYGHDPGRFLLTSSIGFDSSIVGLFWTLSTGGTIVLPDDDTVHDVDRLGDLVADRQVTHTLMVPSLHRALLARRSDRLSGLRVAIVAGEPCPVPLVDEHETALPLTELVNEYGPTEATVWVTADRLTSERGWVPIGGPIPGVRVRVAGVGLERLPGGVAGELLVAGPTVSSGYLADDVATAERFVEFDGHRWYRTGDQVRLRDGLLEFVGRVDDQLNVGGTRLEPAEIEGELRRWPGVREAVVVATGEPAVLVAHLEIDQALDEAALRARLAATLPPGSTPRRFLCWPALPRTVHGKIDRSACAEVAADTDRSAHAGGAPGGEQLVDRIVMTWSAVLGRDDIGADTDFFDIGGDSLAAVEVVTRIGDELGREVAIGTLLAASTPRELAAVLVPAPTSARDDDEVRLVTLRRGTDDGATVVMTPAWDDVFGYQALAQSFPDHVRVLALAYHEQPGRPVITTVDELVTRSVDRVRSAIGGRSPVAILGWSVGGVVAVELAERLHPDGGGVEFVAAVDTFFPGEHRHLWSNRWWKYKSMLRPGAYGAAGRELGVMARRRVQRLVGRVGRRLVLWSGGELPEEPRRTSVGGFPVDALDHPLERVDTPMIFYAATTTNPRRTFERWRQVAGDLVVVPVEGRHRGLDSVMAADRVASVSDDLVARL